MNKKAILYTRVSTDDQADRGYSLRDQEERLIRYCEIKSISIAAIFREDHSAKIFDRPEFKKLMKYARQNKKEIDKVLFIKWDRFSRNVSESYRVIDEFFKMGIELVAIEQPIDMTIPENKFMLAMFLTAPEVENDRRSMNTTFGMRRARKEGRWVCTAPMGYENKRDELNKPIIVPDDKARFVRIAFEQLAEGFKPAERIRLELWQMGFKCSRSNFANLIRNPVYAGKIILKAYRNEPEEIVDGIHEPLISEELFSRVQDVLAGRRQTNKKPLFQQNNPELPLRGLIYCPGCDQRLTGSGSRGNGGRYFYYHCNYCRKERIRADRVDAALIAFLKQVKLNPAAREPFRQILRLNFSKYENQGAFDKAGSIARIEKIRQRLKMVQDRFADGELNSMEYGEMKSRYLTELSGLESQITEKNKITAGLEQLITKAMKTLENIDRTYINAEIEEKQLLLNAIFNGKMYCEGNKVRTTSINTVVSQILSINDAFSENKKGQPQNFKQLSCRVAPIGLLFAL